MVGRQLRLCRHPGPDDPGRGLQCTHGRGRRLPALLRPGGASAVAAGPAAHYLAWPPSSPCPALSFAGVPLPPSPFLPGLEGPAAMRDITY